MSKGLWTREISKTTAIKILNQHGMRLQDKRDFLEIEGNRETYRVCEVLGFLEYCCIRC